MAQKTNPAAAILDDQNRKFPNRQRARPQAPQIQPAQNGFLGLMAGSGMQQQSQVQAGNPAGAMLASLNGPQGPAGAPGSPLNTVPHAGGAAPGAGVMGPPGAAGPKPGPAVAPPDTGGIVIPKEMDTESWVREYLAKAAGNLDHIDIHDLEKAVIARGVDPMRIPELKAARRVALNKAADKRDEETDKVKAAEEKETKAQLLKDQTAIAARMEKNRTRMVTNVEKETEAAVAAGDREGLVKAYRKANRLLTAGVINEIPQSLRQAKRDYNRGVWGQTKLSVEQKTKAMSDVNKFVFGRHKTVSVDKDVKEKEWTGTRSLEFRTLAKYRERYGGSEAMWETKRDLWEGHGRKGEYRGLKAAFGDFSDKVRNLDPKISDHMLAQMFAAGLDDAGSPEIADIFRENMPTEIVEIDGADIAVGPGGNFSKEYKALKGKLVKPSGKLSKKQAAAARVRQFLRRNELKPDELDDLHDWLADNNILDAL